MAVNGTPGRPKTHLKMSQDLMANLHAAEKRMVERQADELQRVQDGVSGVTKNFNVSQEWALRLATAHALLAIAVELRAQTVCSFGVQGDDVREEFTS